MKIDISMLYNLDVINIDEEVIIPKEYYENLSVKSIENLTVKGRIFINYEDEVEADLIINGTFIMPCSITLEDVMHDFSSNINEILTINKDKSNISLELLDVLWENIVSEVPIKVTKQKRGTHNYVGNGWELKTDD